MCPLRYYPTLRRSNGTIYLRFELMRYAREHGVKPPASSAPHLRRNRPSAGRCR